MKSSNDVIARRTATKQSAIVIPRAGVESTPTIPAKVGIQSKEIRQKDKVGSIKRKQTE